MFHNSNASANAENDSWSFSFDYQRFSTKNKPKSLLGRRTLGQVFVKQNENDRSEDKVSSCNRPLMPDRTPLKFQNLNGPSLTYPANPNLTPKLNKAFESQVSFSTNSNHKDENDSRNCNKGVGFSTPFRIKDCFPPKGLGDSGNFNVIDSKPISSKLNGKKEISKDLSSVFVSSNSMNKYLNTSFICEDAYPLSGDCSLSNDADQRIKLSNTDKTTDMSLTENSNNSCFMTAHEINLPCSNSFRFNEFKTPRRMQDTFNLKTPGRNFTLFSISQSPIDPLNGILNEDNESFHSNNSLNFTSSFKNNDSNEIAIIDDCHVSSVNDSLRIDSSEIVELERKENENLESENNENEILDSEKKANENLESEKIGNEVLDADKKETEIYYCKTEPLSENDVEMQTLPLESFVKLEEVTQIPRKSPQNVDCKDNQKLVTPVNHESKSSKEEISRKADENSLLKSSQKVNNQIQAPSIINKVHPNFIHQPMQRAHVPLDPLINSRLILKPLPQNILYINNKPYAALSLLGRGGSSEVYQVLEENSSRLLAVKCVNLANVEESTANGYLNEIELLSKLQGCSSVIKMFDHEYVESTKMLYVVMELGDIDLSKLIKDISKIKKIPMSMIIYYWTEMLSAVKDIHDKGVIHSDLKPANFLLVCGRLKLIDFGIASSLHGDMTSVEKDVIRGTFNYISPEAITAGENRFHKISYKSDVWSLGCILYNLLFGCTPFSHISSTLGKFQAIADPNNKIKIPKDCKHVPPALKLSLRWSLIKDPKSRPTVDRLLQLAEHAIRMPQIDNLWYQHVLKEFPDCRLSLEDIEN